MTAGNVSIAIGIILVVVAGIALRVFYRRRKDSAAAVVKRKESSDFVIMIGLVLSSVLDPAAKNRIEVLDSQRKRKAEPGRENA